MDFASLMAKEISKAKQATTPATSSSGDGKPAEEKKYVRRAELEAARLKQYQEEQERLRREREEKALQKRKLEEEEAERKRQREEKRRRLAEESRKRREAEEEAAERERRRRLGLPELPPSRTPSEDPEKKQDSGEEVEDIPDDDLIAKLRGLGEPAKLFGETHEARLRRYRRLLRKSKEQKQVSKGPIPTTLELVPEAEMKVPKKLPKEPEARKFIYRQLASFFTMVFEEWEIMLDKRDIAVKESRQGRQAYNAMVQARESMKPLFALFERGDVEEAILEGIVEIVHCAQERRYVDANDAYLRLSIGKA